jgi:hypothetical protein
MRYSIEERGNNKLRQYGQSDEIVHPRELCCQGPGVLPNGFLKVISDKGFEPRSSPRKRKIFAGFVSLAVRFFKTWQVRPDFEKALRITCAFSKAWLASITSANVRKLALIRENSWIL